MSKNLKVLQLSLLSLTGHMKVTMIKKSNAKSVKLCVRETKREREGEGTVCLQLA